MFKRFVIYGIAGWGMEIIWTGLFSLFDGDANLRGATSIWMFTIYGSSVFLEPIHDIIRKWPLIARGFLWMVIIWGIEYTTGLFFSLFNIYPWSYDGIFSVDGLVRLDYGPAWFIVGFIFEKLHDTLDRYEIA